MNRFASAIFCDDIRFEVGNKFTLAGVYSADMFFEELPGFIPKFGVSMRFDTPMDKPVKAIRFKVYKGDEVLADIDVPVVVPDAAEQSPTVRLDGHDVPTRRQYNFNVLLPPIMITAPCTLRATVLADDVEYVAGKLRIGPIRNGVAPTEAEATAR